MPHWTPMVCQWVPMGSVMGYPLGIGITKRFPNTRSIPMFPDTRSLGICRHIPQQLVFPKGKYQIPGVFVYSGTYPNNWYFQQGNTKYPGYSYIQAHTPTIGISEEIPNTRSIFIFRQIPKQLVFPKGNTKCPQYSYIQA